MQSTFCPVQAKGGQRELHRSLLGQRATGFDFVELQSIPAPFAIQSRNYGSKDRAVDVSGSKVYPPPPAVGIVCSSLPVQRATINGLTVKEHLSAWLENNPRSLRWMIVCSCLLLDYRRTNAGRRCHCDLVPTMLFTERSETSKERVNLNVSDNSKVKEETESHLLGWSTQAMPKEHSFLFSCFISTVSAGLKQPLFFVPDLIL